MIKLYQIAKHNHKRVKRFVIYLIIIISSQSCSSCIGKESLFIQNNSSFSISVYFNDDENFSAIYPDTTISSFQELIYHVSSGEKKSTQLSSNWDNTFTVTVPNDTLSIIIFHTDTLNKYSWEEIRESYNILKRYDLSLDDLKKLNFIVSYPPGAGMEGIQMYPPE